MDDFKLSLWFRLRMWWWRVSPWSRFQHWRAVRQCARLGCDVEGGTYRGEYQTAYWWRCRRCGEGDTSE